MRKILWLARREYLAAVKTKGFILALVFAPVVMSGSAIVMMLFGDDVETIDRKVAVVDRSGVVFDGLLKAAEERNETGIFHEETGKKIRPAYVLEEVAPNEEDPVEQRLELSNQVRSGEIYAFVEIGRDVLHPGENTAANRITYYAQNAAMDNIPGWMAWPLNTHLRKLRMEEAGVNQETIDDVLIYLGVQRKGLVSVDESGAIKDARSSHEAEAVLLPIGMVMLMFFMIMMGGGSMLNSVMEEKTQRISEVILAAIRPFAFMMGKLLGGIAVALTASSVYVLAAVVVVIFMGVAEYAPFHIIPWFFAYMLMAVLMYGAVFGMLGAICSEPKDAQNLMFPAMIPMMIPMFVLVPVAKEPLGVLATVLSLTPPFTPALMMARMASPMEIPLWQPIVGLVGVAAFTLLMVWIGGRIFRVGILMQGKPPHLKDLVRWAVRG